MGIKWTMSVFFMKVYTQSTKSWKWERTNVTEKLSRHNSNENNLTNTCKAIDSVNSGYKDFEKKVDNGTKIGNKSQGQGIC